MPEVQYTQVLLRSQSLCYRRSYPAPASAADTSHPAAPTHSPASASSSATQSTSPRGRRPCIRDSVPSTSKPVQELKAGPKDRARSAQTQALQTEK
ncbi:hypothetical protein KUCAC02_000643 [Chaenocephalus aceratus]|uniref:Uncharacterized protein n=1 Tax=Chaenocephalus aceratus TaxID=36190 RepID=A0ACB9W647_CHAAC|nr:hypothetical protein KUCAC02_000643 [Chaenocephalus aceratus]